VKKGDGEEIEKAGNDIKEKEGDKKRSREEKMAAECVQMHYLTPAVVNSSTCRERHVTRILMRKGQTANE
jgi:hypothetical protein